jgi:hypothetical protein
MFVSSRSGSRGSYYRTEVLNLANVLYTPYAHDGDVMICISAVKLSGED